MKTITLKITKKHIARSRGGAYDCPVFHALKAVYPDCTEVYRTTVELRGGRSVPLPKSVVSYIEQYDSGKAVKPRSFKIRLPGRISL